MDTVMRSGDAPKFFQDTQVVKSNDDFDTKADGAYQAQTPNSMNGLNSANTATSTFDAEMSKAAEF